MKTCNQIRREFIEFFEQRGHAFVPSSSLLPADDPTLLFTNAGMNQFKDLFLGRETRSYTRAANSQKCIRAGGKHNDLEDVGKDHYHHTFFEMLGNWSFGDYFKAEAIAWAWELLTDVWKLDPRRLHATYFQGDPKENLEPDTEARELWLRVLPPERIHPGNKKDNFWEMGETGPCGPCSEIHYDFTPDFSGGPLVNAGDARVVEIWNNVFMQFNRDESGKLSPLPARHVDTGMGFERISRVLQGVDSNYDIDVFRGIFRATEKFAKAGPYGGELEDVKDIAYRVIADHSRTLTFAIADGVIPSNEGRGYVLRRVLRRACRYGRQYLGIEGAFLSQLVPTVVELMGESFPEIRARQAYVIDTIRSEEESFGRTLDRGIDLFDKQAGKLQADGGKTISGKLAFDLYATYGFPLDLTQLMAAERDLSVDVEGYDAEMTRHKATSGGGEQFKVAAIVGLPATDDSAKYEERTINAKVLGWVTQVEANKEGVPLEAVTNSAVLSCDHPDRQSGLIGAKATPFNNIIDPSGEKVKLDESKTTQFISRGVLAAGASVSLVLDKTNFYAEQGGQIGDVGEIRIEGGDGLFEVDNTVQAGQCVLHVGTLVKGTLRVGQDVHTMLDPQRRDTERNHTATHLLNNALRVVLGTGVNQAGSLVEPERLRFDFTHGLAVTREQLDRVEALVNKYVQINEELNVNVVPLAEAKSFPGVRAVFGEKYPDPVRVVTIYTEDLREGCSWAAEFCGGTHVKATGDIGLFKIIAEESVSKGVRRITAVTGDAALAYVHEQELVLRELTAAFRCGVKDLPARVEAMQKEIKDLRKKPASSGGSDLTVVAAMETSAGKAIVARSPAGDTETLRTLCDQLRQKGHVAIFVGGVAEGKVTLVAMVDDALAKSGQLKAGDWVKAAAPAVDGSGGGKPTFAQAGGKKPEGLDEALRQAAAYAKEKLG